MSPSYEISIPHFYCLEYQEGERLLRLEIDFRDQVVVLDKSLVTGWEAPHAKELISMAEKARVLSNIRDYLVRERGFSNVEYTED